MPWCTYSVCHCKGYSEDLAARSPEIQQCQACRPFAATWQFCPNAAKTQARQNAPLCGSCLPYNWTGPILWGESMTFCGCDPPGLPPGPPGPPPGQPGLPHGGGGQPPPNADGLAATWIRDAPNPPRGAIGDLPIWQIDARTLNDDEQPIPLYDRAPAGAAMEEESEAPKTISPPTACGPMPPQPPCYGALRPGSSQEQSDSIQLTRIEEALTAVNTKLDAVRSEYLKVGNSLEQLLLCWDAAADRENARTLERERTLELSAGEWTPPSTAAYTDTTWNSANSVNSVTPTQVPG
jgi:hypothetical protein